MRRVKFLHIFIMIVFLVFIFENPNIIINFFNNAETHLSKKIEEFSSNGFLVSNDDLAELEDSGITGKEYTFDERFYPYYDMLTIEGQLLYKQVYANIKELAKNFIPTINVSCAEVQNVMEAVFNDHPELFWINTIYTYKYIEDNVVVQITLDYNETVNHFEESKKQFETVSNRIIQNAKLLESDIEKEKYVHDEILKIADYELETDMNQSAYSALVKGKTVCAGYARAFQYIMIELGIPTYYVSGSSLQNHAWNILLLDGEYYNVDLTWDKSNHSYQFFNLTDQEMETTHKRNNLSIHLPKCNGTKYKYIKEENIPSHDDITPPDSNIPSEFKENNQDILENNTLKMEETTTLKNHHKRENHKIKEVTS